MFERFTEPARQVVVLAQEEAGMLMHAHVGTEHILLGLLREQEGIAAQVLDSLGISIDDVRPEVARIGPTDDKVTAGTVSFTPRAKRVLELALREALGLGHDDIGTEAILLGLVREREGVAARVLLGFDAGAETIRNAILQMLPPRGRPLPVARPPRAVLPTLPHHETDDGVSKLVQAVSSQIAQHLRRPVDAGDLLVALASVPDGLVARTLAVLGIDPAAVAAAVAEARSQPTPAGLVRLLELDGEIEAVRAQTRAHTRAANELRAREGELVDQARELDERRLGHALTEIRERLELPDAQGP